MEEAGFEFEQTPTFDADAGSGEPAPPDAAPQDDPSYSPGDCNAGPGEPVGGALAEAAEARDAGAKRTVRQERYWMGLTGRQSLAAAALASIGLHALLIVGVYLALVHWNFLPSSLFSEIGRGDPSRGSIAHDGSADQPAGSAGDGSLSSGWAPPAAPMQSTPSKLAISDDPPDEAAPDRVATPAQLAPPPPDDAPLPAPPWQTPVDLSAMPARDHKAPTLAPADDRSPPSSAAPAPGFRLASAQSDKADPGGLLRRTGAGGSGGGGGAVTGDGGLAVTGLPSTIPGVVGGPTRPDYPAECKRRGEQGSVTLGIEVLANGKIGSIHTLRVNGSVLFARAAIEAAEQDQYVPATHEGRPVTSTWTRQYRFTLSH